MKVILASESEFKARVLSSAGVTFQAVSNEYEEDMSLDLEPEKLAVTLALGKAKDVAKKVPDAIIISTDVFTMYDNQVLGKPKTAAEAKERLLQYRGQQLIVITGLVVMKGEEHLTHTERAVVTFRSDLTEEEIDAYIATGLPMKSSGVFTHHDIGVNVLEKLEGDHTSVIGLPIYQTLKFLRKFGVKPLCQQ